MIILKYIFKTWAAGTGLYRSGSRQGQVVDSCECGNEPSVSTKLGEFLIKSGFVGFSRRTLFLGVNQLVGQLVSQFFFITPFLRSFLFLFLISFFLILTICLFLLSLLIALPSLCFSGCPGDGQITFSSSSSQNYIFYRMIINYSTHVFHTVLFNNVPFIRPYFTNNCVFSY